MNATIGIIDREKAVLMQTYGRQPVAFVSGDGSWLTDADGKTYLDCLGGLAVVAVGHGNPRVAAAVAAQMSRLVHVSNLYFTEPMVLLAERLTTLSGLDRVFFCNDGATANEAAIKLARRYGQSCEGLIATRSFRFSTPFTGGLWQHSPRPGNRPSRPPSRRSRPASTKSKRGTSVPWKWPSTPGPRRCCSRQCRARAE